MSVQGEKNRVERERWAAELLESAQCQAQLTRAIEVERNENSKLRARILVLERELNGDFDPKLVGEGDSTFVTIDSWRDESP